MKNTEYEKKRKANILVGILIFTIIIVLLCLIRNKDGNRADTTSVDYKMEHDLCITHLGSYTGPYMEDASDEAVSNVMMIHFMNQGEKTLQYAEITLSAGEEEYLFKVSTLEPGQTVRILEADRKSFEKDISDIEPSMKNVVFFTESLELYEDTLDIQPLDGGFNITNVSQEDITGEIMVYFKDVDGDILNGGITYRGRIENGLKSGEIKQIMTKNFSKENTKVMFITITQ